MESEKNQLYGDKQAVEQEKVGLLTRIKPWFYLLHLICCLDGVWEESVVRRQAGHGAGEGRTPH